MSNADPAEVSKVVSRDGVTVEKSFEPDDFPVPAIAFVIRAERDEAVAVQLSDEVPDQVDAEDIGFHPKYGAEFWSVEEGDIVFEREFEEGEEYTTVYGLRASQTDDVESYMSEPTVEEVDPPLDDAGQVVRDVIGEDEADAGGPSADDIEAAIAAADGDADDVSDEDEDDDPVEPLRLSDPNDAGDVEPELDADERTDEQVVAEAAITEVGGAPDDPVAALAQQIRAGGADDEDLAALRRALGDGGGDGSRDARIKQLQSELADLRAYTNALEEFLDENGDAQKLIRDVKGSVERVDEDLDALSAEVADARDRGERVEGELDELHGDVGELSEDVGTVHEEVESVQNDVADVENSVAAVDEDVDELAADVEDIEASLDRVDDLDDRLDELEDEFEDAREDLQALSQMREQLSSVFGAQVQGPGDDDGGDGDDEE